MLQMLTAFVENKFYVGLELGFSSMQQALSSIIIIIIKNKD